MKTLSKEELNAACADALGWESTRHPEGVKVWRSPKWPLFAWVGDEELPDWSSSHDACQQLRDALSGQESAKFGVELALLVIDGDEIDSGDDFFAISNATPEQICKAFMAAKGIK